MRKGPPIVEMTGKKFGKLLVLEQDPIRTKDRLVRWKCLCDCGNTLLVSGASLRDGNNKSCGKCNSPSNLKHGLSGTKLYMVWVGMKQRCNNPKSDGYENWGGRGIKVCPEWEKDFKAFHDWSMANGYQEGLCIDRKDNDGNYEPGNCKWSTYSQQISNRRSSRLWRRRPEENLPCWQKKHEPELKTKEELAKELAEKEEELRKEALRRIEKRKNRISKLQAKINEQEKKIAEVELKIERPEISRYRSEKISKALKEVEQCTGSKGEINGNDQIGTPGLPIP